GKRRLLKKRFCFNENSSVEERKDCFGRRKKALKRAVGSLGKNGWGEKRGFGRKFGVGRKRKSVWGGRSEKGCWKKKKENERFTFGR
ncbi:hypothetical protein ACWYBU_01880, partial [Fusobacterium polymorphum]